MCLRFLNLVSSCLSFLLRKVVKLSIFLFDVFMRILLCVVLIFILLFVSVCLVLICGVGIGLLESVWISFCRCLLLLVVFVGIKFLIVGLLRFVCFFRSFCSCCYGWWLELCVGLICLMMEWGILDIMFSILLIVVLLIVSIFMMFLCENLWCSSCFV